MQLGEFFGRFLPGAQLQPTPSGAHSRRRFYSLGNTFWAFLTQVLAPEGGCREAVAKLQSYAPLKVMDLVGGRRVIVVDGTGVSMPDTEANQREWPQQSQQRPG